jgi:NADH-quinone oxidoreductase subunit J
MSETVLFWLLAVPLLLSASGVLVARNPVYAAMSLVATLFFLAGIYLLLTAELVAVLQILVYAGAVIVLFLFVIMLLSLSDEQLGMPRVRAIQAAGVLGAAGIVALVVKAIRDLGWLGMAALPADASGVVSFGTVKAVGLKIFTEYLLPFEATSILLLVAIVGAVVVAKERI